MPGNGQFLTLIAATRIRKWLVNTAFRTDLFLIGQRGIKKPQSRKTAADNQKVQQKKLCFDSIIPSAVCRNSIEGSNHDSFFYSMQLPSFHFT